MGIFDKLMFWKKQDDLDLGNINSQAGMPADMGQIPSDPFSTEMGIPQQQFGQYRQQMAQPQYSPQQPFSRMDYAGQQQPSYGNKDLEVVSAKLDALKAYMDSINQRLANLERIAEGQSGRRW
jgi:hypothetical protein